MTRRNLSPEIVSLIHHVELNQSGWWKKAVGQVIKGVLWKTNRPLTIAEIRSAIKSEIGIDMPSDNLEKQISALLSSKEVQKLSADTLKLSEETFAELTQAHDKATAEQDACKDSFIDSINEFCPTLESHEVWKRFRTALITAVRVIGANTFHLLANGRLEQEADWLSNFIGHFNEECHDGLRIALSKFFSPENRVCRSQILRLMSAHFFAEAAQLNQKTIDAIESKRKKRTVRLVLDTNFIFSVLGLHDNPANDSAISLLDIAKKSSKFLDIRLNILPQTLEETQKAISTQLHLIENIRFSRSMFNVARRAHLPSIAANYFAVAQKSNGISAREYLQPYIDDLRTILKSKGIEILDAQPGLYHQRQDVIDDIHDEIQKEKTRKEDQQKGYATIQHDVVLWHVVSDRRDGTEDSPLDVGIWAVSLDWRLIKFDQRKLGNDATRPPMVLYPTNLMQLIQFWIPRSEEIESSVVDSLRLPLFFQKFDPEDEQVTIKILEVISRYENVDDLPEGTVRNILANKVLRGRIKEVNLVTPEVVELINAEVVAENKRALEQLQATKVALLAASNAAKEAEEKAKSEEHRRIAEETARLELAHELEIERGTTKSTTSELEEMRTQTQQLSEKLQRTQDFQSRQSFLFLNIALPIVASVVLGILTWYFLPLVPIKVSLATLVLATGAVVILTIGAGLRLAQGKIDTSSAISEWWPGKIVRLAYHKILVGGGMLAISAIWQGGVWDGIKSLFSTP